MTETNVAREDKHDYEPLLSLADLARMLGVGRRTLHTWRAAGHLPEPDFKIGQTLRWRRKTIERWIDKGGGPEAPKKSA